MTEKEILEKIKKNEERIEELENQIDLIEQENEKLLQEASKLILGDINENEDTAVVNLSLNTNLVKDLEGGINKIIFDNSLCAFQIVQKGSVIIVFANDENGKTADKLMINFHGMDAEDMEEIGDIVYEKVVRKLNALNNSNPVSYKSVELGSALRR